MPNGLLLVDKPVGTRSAECVSRVKCLLGKDVKVGHAGTLDSTASGLLLLLLGKATRLSDYVMKLPKKYEASARLGVSTDTCDASGQVIFRGDASRMDERALDRVLCSFWGTRMQRPPEISALKVNGKASHKMARRGEVPDLTPRPVSITAAARSSSLLGGRVTISVFCGKGTYIRGIVRDMGTALGCGAHVEALRRLSIGAFHVSDAYALEELEELGNLKNLINLRELGRPFHRIVLTKDAERRLLNGLCVPLADAGRYFPGTIGLGKGLCVEGERMIGFARMTRSSEKGPVLLKSEANIVDVES
ncbi:MAG: tRNA pseudouridine(55) synthase TruB [Synergistaceae bacterium]|jgi:tRNA pseudouridine(55) synthase|nr:tRNA pseudouridine(55) synthase TruB [Synergistaceae bacterium]